MQWLLGGLIFFLIFSLFDSFSTYILLKLCIAGVDSEQNRWIRYLFKRYGLENGSIIAFIIVNIIVLFVGSLIYSIISVEWFLIIISFFLGQKSIAIAVHTIHIGEHLDDIDKFKKDFPDLKDYNLFKIANLWKIEVTKKRKRDVLIKKIFLKSSRSREFY